MLLLSSRLIGCSTYKQSVHLKCIDGLEVHYHFILHLFMAVLNVYIALSPKKITVGDEGEIRAIENGVYFIHHIYIRHIYIHYCIV